jgi:hypothetical protein
VLGQAASVPAPWIGTWTLSTRESKFGVAWGPGAPDGLTVTGQTLKITATASHMKVAGDTVTAERGSLHEESDLNLDGTETILAPGLTVAFRRIDDTSFDIIRRMNKQKLGNHIGKNHFVFSADGKILTETKTHTEREVVSQGMDQTKSAVIRTSTIVLVFHKDPDWK